jgi:hypothetical protein
MNNINVQISFMTVAFWKNTVLEKYDLVADSLHIV